jgi:hypothetical protein
LPEQDFIVVSAYVYVDKKVIRNPGKVLIPGFAIGL